MKWLYRLTGGRPMRYKCCLFVDKVARREVNLYEDHFGREWMAFGAWDLFRIRYKEKK